MATTDLAFTTDFDAPPARVFAALTEARHLTRWFCDEADVEPRVGGRIVLRWTRSGASPQPTVGSWTTFDPPHACAYEGGHSGYPDGTAGLVSFMVAPRGKGSRLLTLHRLPDRPEFDRFVAVYSEAWPRALARLAEFLTPRV